MHPRGTQSQNPIVCSPRGARPRACFAPWPSAMMFAFSQPRWPFRRHTSMTVSHIMQTLMVCSATSYQEALLRVPTAAVDDMTLDLHYLCSNRSSCIVQTETITDPVRATNCDIVVMSNRPKASTEAISVMYVGFPSPLTGLKHVCSRCAAQCVSRNWQAGQTGPPKLYTRTRSHRH